MSLFHELTTGAALPEQYLGIAILAAIIALGIVVTFRAAVRWHSSRRGTSFVYFNSSTTPPNLGEVIHIGGCADPDFNGEFMVIRSDKPNEIEVVRMARKDE